MKKAAVKQVFMPFNLGVYSALGRVVHPMTRFLQTFSEQVSTMKVN